MFQKIKYIIFVFCMCFPFYGVGQNYQLAEQDSLALVAFYHATNGENWISNQDDFDISDLSSDFQGSYNGGFGKWLEGPVDQWYGVKIALFDVPGTDEKVYRVTDLAPVLGRRSDGQNQLSGYLPKELGLLTKLETFKVNGNTGLAGTRIPDEVFHPSLRVFDVEGCNLDGDISAAIHQCTLLQVINARYNGFDFMPVLDFLPEQTLRNNPRYWFYSCELPFTNMEKTIDYFYSLSSNPKEFFFEARDNNNVGDEIEIVAPIGTSVEMVCNDAGEKDEFITYKWFKDGLSRFGKTKKTYTISSVKESDYGEYTVQIENDYVKTYDQNSNYGQVFTKPIHLVPEPTAPEIIEAKTSYNGQQLILFCSKRMDESVTGFDKFIVNAGEQAIEVTDAMVTGRINRFLVLNLAEPIKNGQSITLSLDAESIFDKNGGKMGAISDMLVVNQVRKAPQFTNAVTAKDGSFVELTANGFIDPETFDNANFQLSGNKNYPVKEVILKEGIFDKQVSTKIRLVLETSINDPDEDLSLNYQSGKIAGLYAGTIDPEDNILVENIIDVNLTEITLTFFDGTGTLSEVVLGGSWLSEPVQMYDDGTNGDLIANDHTWSIQLPVADDIYSWDVYSRETIIERDTIKEVDSETGIETITVVPTELHIDSILNEGNVLDFSIEGGIISGTLHYAISNINIIFKLTANAVNEEVFLMGIDDDWGDGRKMVFDGTYYTDTLYAYSVGDVIEYNYRIGNDWENVSVNTRSHTVVPGTNIIYNTFGVFTTGIEQLKERYKIYYNPYTNQVVLDDKLMNARVLVTDLMGRTYLEKSIEITSDLKITTYNLNRGIYVVCARLSSGKNVSTVLIIK